MPRFHINFRNGDEIAQDREGTELPSLEAAKELAMNSARELLADSVKTGSKSLLRAVIVADEDGRELLTIPSKEILAGPLR